jgi:tetratricopeptide (TPR) repeat protein
MLYSDEVKRFFNGADEALKTGANLDWDVISKAAVLHYYRMYFEKEEGKFAEAKSAHEWIVRALTMNPLHVDLTIKLADTLAMMDRNEEAVAILERIVRSEEAPPYVKQWLGYYMLELPERLDDAIRYSEEFHAAFPCESDSIFNVAYAYALKYCQEIRRGNGRDSQNRTEALSKLRQALEAQPEYAETIRSKWVSKGEAFQCFLQDEQFLSLVGLDKNQVENKGTGGAIASPSE